MVSLTDQQKLAESFMTEEEGERGSRRNLERMNHLMQHRSGNASVVFTALPHVPEAGVNAHSYMHDLDLLSSKLFCM